MPGALSFVGKRRREGRAHPEGTPARRVSRGTRLLGCVARLVRFAKKDEKTGPEHWRTFGPRGSPMTGAPRLAANPANALLNYLYALLEAEARFACFACGLDPGSASFRYHKFRDSWCSTSLKPSPSGRRLPTGYVRGAHLQRQGLCRDAKRRLSGACAMTHTLAETTSQWARASRRWSRMCGDTPGRIRPFTIRNANAADSGAPQCGARRLRRKPRTGTVPKRKPAATCATCADPFPSRTAVLRRLPARRRTREARPLRTGGTGRAGKLRAEGRDPTVTADARHKLGRVNCADNWTLRDGTPKTNSRTMRVHERDTAGAERRTSIANHGSDGVVPALLLTDSAGVCAAPEALGQTTTFGRVRPLAGQLECRAD